MVSYPLKLELHAGQTVRECDLTAPGQLREQLCGPKVHLIKIKNIAAVGDPIRDLVEADRWLQELVTAEVKQAGFAITNSYLNISYQVFESWFELIPIAEHHK